MPKGNLGAGGVNTQGPARADDGPGPVPGAPASPTVGAPGGPTWPTHAPATGWTAGQRATWAEWFQHVLREAYYIVPQPQRGGGVRERFYPTALADRCGLDVDTVKGVFYRGNQPSPRTAAALARGLGLHPVTVLYRAGLMTHEEYAALIGAGALPSAAALRAELAAIDRLPDSPEWAEARERMRENAERTLGFVERVARELGIAPEDVGVLPIPSSAVGDPSAEGGAAGAVVRREVVGDATPIAAPRLPPGFAAALAPATRERDVGGAPGGGGGAKGGGGGGEIATPGPRHARRPGADDAGEELGEEIPADER